MPKCIICGKPHNRTKANSLTIPALYCSTKCIKHSWVFRNKPNGKRFFRNDPLFWKTETGIGYKWELWAAKRLGAIHLPFNKNGVDLDLNGKKIDVKVSNLFKRKLARGKPTNSSGSWIFNRGKTKPCDFFFCICLEKNKVEKVFNIPDRFFPKSGISIGKVSKYDIFAF